jgi:hypothetical protein
MFGGYMPRGKKISDEKKEEVRALVYIHPEMSNTELSRETGIPRPTIIDMKKDEGFIDKDKFDECRQNKKREFIQNAWRVVEKALLLTEKRFDKALDDEAAIKEMIDAINASDDMTQAQKKALTLRLNALQMTNIKDIAIALGTIYDKQAMAAGDNNPDFSNSASNTIERVLTISVKTTQKQPID